MENFICPICGKPSKLNFFGGVRDGMLCNTRVKDLKCGKLT